MAKILQRSRYVASASLSAAVTIGANSTNSVITTVSNAISNLPKNSIARIALLASAMQTDAGAPFLTVQNAALVADNGDISAPAFTGSPLGLANGSRFSGEIRFHSEDVTDATFDAELQVLVKNTDSVSHQVTTLNITLEVEIVTFDAPIYAEALVGI